ncbi:hypothetical protein HY989_02090 [Candidatus Micrarchaeota archaeon]|nr:hypothetical protein [Candidatus Micrarchaeota archaeon]
MPKLPEAVFQRRVLAEYQEMQKSGYKFSVNPDRTAYEISMEARALQKIAGKLSVLTSHKFKIEINRNYPYAGGFSVVWLTPIFHPNIDNKTGKVCIHLLNDWAASQTIASLVKGIEHLLKNPNVKSPLNVEAGEYFYFHPELIEGKFQGIESGSGKPKIVLQK